MRFRLRIPTATHSKADVLLRLVFSFDGVAYLSMLHLDLTKLIQDRKEAPRCPATHAFLIAAPGPNAVQWCHPGQPALLSLARRTNMSESRRTWKFKNLHLADDVGPGSMMRVRWYSCSFSSWVGWTITYLLDGGFWHNPLRPLVGFVEISEMRTDAITAQVLWSPG